MPECERCDRWFNPERALEQHKDNSAGHNICYPCDRDFTTHRGLIQHYTQSLRHAYCQYCDEHFDDFDDLHEHYEEEHHWCDLCNKFFQSEFGLHEHRRQSHADRYCVPCKRMFRNPHNLLQHENSSIHRGLQFACPMKGCDRWFVSLSALVLHLEAGTCTSGMTRKMLDELIARYDKRHIITNPDRLLTGPGGTSRARTQVTDEWATERAWNGRAYECYLCHKTFATLLALNAHLRSPAHADKMYHCPTAFGGCGTEFRTMSAFCQHMENAKCGAHRFRSTIEDYVRGLPDMRQKLVGYNVTASF
ncbi:hypothetical protein C8Q80DRAFT_1192899 [Daedaleopsis nitida]|nr:hypothetical protein C8Q80DRAFT_1192899 [Daedaleopsis nitida]